MTNQRRRLVSFWPLWVAAAFLLAFFLRGLVLRGIIQPLLYLFWLLKLMYQAIPQLLLWAAVVAVLSLLALSFITRQVSFANLFQNKRAPKRGPLQELAHVFQRKSEGTYFQWQVARLLATTALGLQEIRQHNKVRALNFDESSAKPAVRRYLKAGLTTSFSDYPTPGPLHPKPRTPFDIDLEQVIAYLESQRTEMDHS